MNIVKKCPNCGASIEHNYNHKCPYCRTTLHMKDETIQNLNNVSIKVLKIEIDRYILEHCFILRIIGISTPKALCYEEYNINKGLLIVSGDDIGKKVGYSIKVPIEMMYDNSPEKLINYVISTLPQGFEESEMQIINMLMEIFISKKY